MEVNVKKDKKLILQQQIHLEDDKVNNSSNLISMC